MTTIVSGLISIKNTNRSIEKYIEFGKKLCQVNINKVIFIEEYIFNLYFKDELYPTTTFYITKKENLYLCKYKDELINFNKLYTNNPTKDTIEYMYIQCNKTEWIRESIEKNPYNSTQFIWIDFGIYHMIKDDEAFNTSISKLQNKSYENIRISSGVSNNPISIYTHVHWGFLGSIFGGNSVKLLQLADLTKKKCIETIKNQKLIMWEINIWFLVFLEHKELFDRYFCNHNQSILTYY